MNKRMTILPMLFALGIFSGACGTQSQTGDGSGGPSAQTGSSQENLVSAAGNILMWPAGPIAWDGMVGTWPISVWAPTAIGGLAFDAVGVTGLGVTAVGMPTLLASTITTPWLNAWTTAAASPWLGLGTPLLGTAGLLAPAYGFQGTFAPAAVGAWGFGAGAASVGTFNASFANNTIFPGLWTSLTPALTTNALMFNDLAITTAMMPYTFNVTFTAAANMQAMASLSIFSTTATASMLAASTIPFTSMIYPIMFTGAAPIIAPAAGIVAPIAPVAPIVARPGLL